MRTSGVSVWGPASWDCARLMDWVLFCGGLYLLGLLYEEGGVWLPRSVPWNGSASGMSFLCSSLLCWGPPVGIESTQDRL